MSAYNISTRAEKIIADKYMSILEENPRSRPNGQLVVNRSNGEVADLCNGWNISHNMARRLAKKHFPARLQAQEKQPNDYVE